MTSGTIREAPDLVFFHQPRPQRALVLRGLIRIVDLEDILPRPDVTFRMPMAIQAPFHLQALCAPSQRHGPHGTVARGAAYSLVHMNAVVEIGNRLHHVPRSRGTWCSLFPCSHECCG